MLWTFCRTLENKGISAKALVWELIEITATPSWFNMRCVCYHSLLA